MCIKSLMFLVSLPASYTFHFYSAELPGIYTIEKQLMWALSRRSTDKLRPRGWVPLGWEVFVPDIKLYLSCHTQQHSISFHRHMNQRNQESIATDKKVEVIIKRKTHNIRIHAPFEGNQHTFKKYLIEQR